MIEYFTKSFEITNDGRTEKLDLQGYHRRVESGLNELGFVSFGCRNWEDAPYYSDKAGAFLQYIWGNLPGQEKKDSVRLEVITSDREFIKTFANKFPEMEDSEPEKLRSICSA